MKTPCTELKGVGQKVADKLAQLNIHTFQDLLFHLPNRYEDRTRLTPINLVVNNQFVVVEGKLLSGKLQFGKRRSFVFTIDDGTGIVSVRLFYFNAPQIKTLSTPNLIVRCSGVMRVMAGKRDMVHPEYEIIDPDNPKPLSQFLTPVYPTTDGITQTLLKKMLKQVLSGKLSDEIELLPDELRSKLQLTNLTDDIRVLHAPNDVEKVGGAIQRLAFDELLAHHLNVKSIRNVVQKQNSYTIASSKVLVPTFLKNLPFELTGAQNKVFSEIIFDLSQPKPMMRLVQGDVGCGKTVVALLAALNIVEEKLQVALMAPTEILAEQHYKNFQKMCAHLGVSISWLSGSIKGKKRDNILEKLRSSETQIIVGTHALFQADVHYHKLGLVIIDEQHRFGVHQRLALFNKGEQAGVAPHQLVMTATPIPRSLAMTAYADLDCSIIDELPPGRTPVKTVAIDNQQRELLIERIRKTREKKQQVYWVCTLIEESEKLQHQAAEKTQELLMETLPEFRVGLIHGRMKSDEKDAVMTAFKNHEYDILVATTVIEVGVDVPNATLMVIENAERLGLSQLHQLRGRVGRGAKKSYCVLLYQNPLTEFARQRLQIMRETNDGFEIANQDLLMRGPGELLGTAQTGEMNFKIADLIRDQKLLPKVQSAANDIVMHYPQLIKAIVERWHLGENDAIKV